MLFNSKRVTLIINKKKCYLHFENVNKGEG